MKPTKKKAAKRPSNPIVTKLLDLKYRINDAYRSYPHETNKNDKTWVVDKLNDVRGGIVLTKGEMLHCNNLWKEYSPSRLNDWVGYKND
mgnify:CR=1 FL=1